MSAPMAERPLTVLILAHVFHPSTEIGAKRVTALARYLVASGVRVVVVSEFGGKAIADGAEVIAGVTAIPVAQPPRLLLDTLVSIKRMLRRGAAETAEASREDTPDYTTAADSRSFLSRIKDSLLDISYAQDRFKRWSWRASRAAV